MDSVVSDNVSTASRAVTGQPAAKRPRLLSGSPTDGYKRGRGWGGVERQIEPMQRRKVKALLVITDANKTP